LSIGKASKASKAAPSCVGASSRYSAELSTQFTRVTSASTNAAACLEHNASPRAHLVGLGTRFTLALLSLYQHKRTRVPTLTHFISTLQVRRHALRALLALLALLVQKKVQTLTRFAALEHAAARRHAREVAGGGGGAEGGAEGGGVAGGEVGRRLVLVLARYKVTNTDAEGLLYWYNSTNTDAEGLLLMVQQYKY
jgi:hypothetical protein